MNFTGSCSIQREKPAKARGGRRSAGFSVYLVVSDIIAFLENHALYKMALVIFWRNRLFFKSIEDTMKT